MSENRTIDSRAELDRILRDTSDTATPERIREILRGLHPSEISDLLEQLPRPQRLEVWAVIEPEHRGEILIELGEGVRYFIVKNTSPEDLATAASLLDSDDLAELIRDLPSELAETVISLLDRELQREVSRVLTYNPDQAGSRMNPQLLKVSPGDNIKTVIHRLRLHKELTLANDVIFVVDEHKRLVGDLLIKQLLLNESKQSIADIMDKNPVSVRAMDSIDEAVRVIRDRDLIALAVVNDENALLGQVTVDDVVDVIGDKQAQAVVDSVGALTRDEDLFLPVWQSTGQRALWLGINLVTAFIASAVVNQFGATIEQAVGLAVLMPIVASMGGIAGSQTMVLVIRGMALNLVNRENISHLVYKELLVGVANGVIWAIIIAVLVHIWMGEFWLTAIIMLALLVNILIGTFSGVLLPLALRLIGADPAISANVILTTVTDVVGLGVFLGVATMYLYSL